MTATFSVSIQSSSLSFLLVGPNNTSVPATVSYNDTTHTATLTPSAALLASSSYTATVSGAKDTVGTAMASPVSWSFTTDAAPTVISKSPGSASVAVGLSSTVTATFSVSIQTSSLSFVLVGPNNVTVPASVSYNDTTHTATLTPSSALSASTTYTATVSGAKDAVGTAMAAPVAWSFTTDALPTITSESPASGATGVALTSTVTATFSVSIQSSSLSFVLVGPNNTSVPASVSYNDTTHTATLTPSAALAGSTTYTATVSGAQDAVGTAMAAPVSWTFTTAASVVPVVTGETPAANASGVAAAAVVTATFNESIQSATLIFTLSGAGGISVPATVSYVDATHTATLQPLALLAASTTYTAVVSGAKDSNGNMMATPFTWSFTTAGPPQLTNETPVPNATGQATSTAVTATFNESILSSSVVFTLDSASGSAVPATVTYNDSTHTVTLQPTTALSPSTTYTAVISGATDANGFTMAAPFTWSFATAAATIRPQVTG